MLDGEKRKGGKSTDKISSFSSFWVFFTVLFLVGGFYMLSRVEGPLNIGGTSINTTSLYGGYAILTIVLLLFSGVTGAIFWIIGAAALIILFHAAVLEPGLEGEFDDQV
jgi:hypothetical protein